MNTQGIIYTKVDTEIYHPTYAIYTGEYKRSTIVVIRGVVTHKILCYVQGDDMKQRVSHAMVILDGLTRLKEFK